MIANQRGTFLAIIGDVIEANIDFNIGSNTVKCRLTLMWKEKMISSEGNFRVGGLGKVENDVNNFWKLLKVFESP